MITAADSTRLRATIHATPTAPLPHRVRTDAEITADFRRVRGEHFARLAEELPSSEAWPLGTEDGSGLAPLAHIVRTVVSNGRRCERDLAASVTAQKNLAAELRTAQAEVEKLRADCAQTADGERAADREVERLRGELATAHEALRDLAAYVGNGGYNAPTVDARIFRDKIREGIDTLNRVESGRRAELEAKHEVACGTIRAMQAERGSWRAQTELRAIASLLGTTDTTGLADRLRARLAGQPREDVCRPFQGPVPDRGIILIARGEPMRWWRCAGLDAVCNSCGLRAANDSHDTMQWQGVDGEICGPCLGADGDVTAVCAACGRVPYDEDGCCDICGADTDANGPIDNDMATAEAETQSEHVITESARRMFEAAMANVLASSMPDAESARLVSRLSLMIARVFAETETQERAERRQS